MHCSSFLLPDYNVPDVDERTWINIKNLYALSLYIALFGSMLLVCILFAFGKETIEFGALYLFIKPMYVISDWNISKNTAGCLFEVKVSSL